MRIIVVFSKSDKKDFLLNKDKEGSMRAKDQSSRWKDDKAKSFSFWIVDSETRLGDLMDFGQLFKAFGNN